MSDATGDNAAQKDYWDGAAGDTWVEAQEQLDAMLEPISATVLAAAAAQAGERVIDIGCGCGAISLAMADAGAQVWGLDLSSAMLARARERAGGRAHFSQGDAAAQRCTPDHDLVFSRFGVMFFEDPVAAFTQLRTALRPGGRLVFVCWQAPRNNPWLSVTGAALQPLLPDTPPPDPLAPGPFAFADPERVRGILESAGFAEVTLTPCEEMLTVGRNVEAAVAFQSRVGPLAAALAELSEAEQDQARSVAADALAPYAGADGVQLGSACWVVQARQN